ncbi:SMEK domain-containing protein [Aeromonas sp. CD]|uniref:SMEK domain-containing protein n=1 Tax=unclassified Aeromonas TaxID=257493 RepID=UPI0029661EBF|nr:SMEK domain-containing protein [Aeromonas sp. CD]WOX53236.1 SMEK domain-containing protein [Aeromonas sp. CD]
MITRGYFIGQIIDELTAVSQQVKNRAGLQLFDLNRYLEDFFKEVLNIVYGYNLINLNEERSNNPGLDLGDEKAKVAFQVTSTKTSEKVNETLRKAATQVDKFQKVYVLILQEKQGSYTLDTELAKPFSFIADEHILDIGDVFKKVLSLPIAQLQSLHLLVSKEVARVKIELEIPDENGIFQTNIEEFVEKIPSAKFEGIKTYYKYLQKEPIGLGKEYGISEQDVTEDFQFFIITLKNLPRITRQFYAFLLARGKWDDTKRFINTDYLQRICKYPDMEGELRLLVNADLCVLHEPDECQKSAEWYINTVRKAKSHEFTWEFMDFVEKNSINLEKVIVSLDFSDFT